MVTEQSTGEKKIVLYVKDLDTSKFHPKKEKNMGTDKNKTFIQFIRNSEDFDYLIKRRPTAFVLLALIAMRAKRTEDHPDISISLGEAYIGDYKIYGVTERVYRSDKELLKKCGLATFHTTNKGTIAKLSKSSIFDINAENSTDKLTVKRQSNDRPETSNNNENKEKERDVLLQIPDSFLSQLTEKYQLPAGYIQEEAQRCYNWHVANGKIRKNYLAAFQNWMAKVTINPRLHAAYLIEKSKNANTEEERENIEFESFKYL